MIDFTKLTGIEHGGKVVTQIEDSAGRVLWVVQRNVPIVLEVEKVISDTYAGETTYTNEEFILLDIYPKTNGTVSVTYGGLTKTITDTSGAEEPNAQQVFFGTFNGVSDSVATPASGELTIEGDYYAFGCSYFTDTSSTKGVAGATCSCISGISNFGDVTLIPTAALGYTGIKHAGEGYKKITSLTIPESVIKIGTLAIPKNDVLTSITFENANGWYARHVKDGTITKLDVSNPTTNVTIFTQTYGLGYEFYRE